MVKWNNRPAYRRFRSEDAECAHRKPATNIREDENAFEIDLAAPGIDKNDIKINLEGDMLEIKYENGKEDETNFTHREFGKHSFCRSFSLPEIVDAEKINANYKDGILSVLLPKKEEAKPVKKEVKIS